MQWTSTSTCCQFELGLTTLMQAQAAVIEDIKQQAKQTSSEFMTLANREMSQMVSLARANGYDATDFDDFETDRKRSKIIIRALRPEYKAELATIFASRRDRTKFDMYVGCSSMTELGQALSEVDGIVGATKGDEDEGKGKKKKKMMMKNQQELTRVRCY